MITLARLDVIRATSPAVADELAHVRDQINAQPSLLSQTQLTVGAAGSGAALPATPSGYAEVVINGVTYVMPFYAQE